MPQKELEAIKKACLYSIPPNRLGYCGPSESWNTLQEFVSSPSGQKIPQTKAILQKFNALYPYLELIAEANSLQPFDLEVVEAYWLGNPLLKNVPRSAIQKTILSFQKLGLPRSIAEQKASQLPEGMLPHHSMHVLYINFISQKVSALVQNLSNCLIQWGEVRETLSQGISIKGIELISESGELKLREKTKTVENPFSIPLQQGDQITVHWGNAVEKISPKTFKNLKTITFKNIELLNLYPLYVDV